MTVKNIPEGYHSVTPYLIIKQADQAVDFYQQAFGAEVLGKLVAPDNSIVHGELQIGDCRVMFCEENKDMDMVGPVTLGGAGINLCLYVEDVDATFAQAISAGAEQLRPVEDQFWGDRSGTVVDPYGHKWTIMTQTEQLQWSEIQKRFEQLFKS